MLELDITFEVLTSQLLGALMQPTAILQSIVMTSPVQKSPCIYK